MRRRTRQRRPAEGERRRSTTWASRPERWQLLGGLGFAGLLAEGGDDGELAELAQAGQLGVEQLGDRAAAARLGEHRDDQQDLHSGLPSFPSRCWRASRRFSALRRSGKRKQIARRRGERAGRQRHRREPGDEDQLHRRRDVGAPPRGADRRRGRARRSGRRRPGAARGRAAARSSGWRGRRARGSARVGAGRARRRARAARARWRAAKPIVARMWARSRSARLRLVAVGAVDPVGAADLLERDDRAEQGRQVDQVPVGADPEVLLGDRQDPPQRWRSGRRWRWSASRPGRRGRRARRARRSPLGIGRWAAA